MISRLTSAFSRLPSSLSFAFFSSSNLSAAQNMGVNQFVDDAIAEHKVVIFSKSWCPYCARVKKLFEDNFPNVNLHLVELDERNDGDSIQNYLKEKTKQRTVPNVFVNQKHIGGSDDTQASLDSGELGKLIVE